MRGQPYEYDIIITGGGLAGRSLAYFLSREDALAGKTILIIDRDHGSYQHRSLIYWHDDDLPIPLQPDAVYAKLAVAGGSTQQTLTLERHHLCVTSSRAVFDVLDRVIDANPNIDRRDGLLIEVATDADSVIVSLSDGRSFRAAFCFDSTLPASGVGAPLVMTGEIRRVRTPEPRFDPAVATFLDFRTGECAPVHFFCVLPLSDREALVEVSVVRPPGADLDAAFFDDALSTYLSELWQAADVSVESIERGSIPLGLRARRSGRRHIRIGTPSGIVKATTGYGLVRILRQTEVLASSLASTGVPRVPRPPRRFSWYDKPVLLMWRTRPEQVADFMRAAFASGAADTVLDFLDERTTFAEERGFLASMPITKLLNPRSRRRASTSAGTPV